ncbi:MAG: hypothetical protein GY855_09925, partial [candidate division Zixibacteria bacterium]|nr:hypothetical protein [candidate division Zixibacteria bacterium]
MVDYKLIKPIITIVCLLTVSIMAADALCQENWEVILHAVGEQIGGAQYEFDAMIGVAAAEETEDSPGPPFEYTTFLQLWQPDLSGPFIQDKRINTSDSFVWIIDFNPHGNVPPEESRSATLSWDPLELSSNGQYMLFRGANSYDDTLITDMRITTSYIDSAAIDTSLFYTLKWSPCPAPSDQPINVQASDDQCEQITVGWEWTAGDFDGFRIFRDSILIGQTAMVERSYVDSFPPDLCQNHFYQIAAYSDSCGTGPFSLPDDGTAQGTPNGIFTDFSASDGNCDSLFIGWAYTPGICPLSGFRIFRDDIQLIELNSDDSLYYDSTAVAGQIYSYYIAAINTCGEGTASNSNDGYIPLSVVDNPTNCQASDDDCLKITVTWDWGGDYHQGFTIFREGAEVGQVDSTVRVFDDNDAPAGVTYDYYVLAYNPCGNGPQSNIDSGFRPESITEAPANVTASDAQCSQVTIDWEWTGTGEDGFIIYRDSDSIDVVGPSGRSYTDTNTPAFCVSYDYQVAAASTNCGEGPLSIADPGTAIGPADGTASNFAASDSDCSLISLSWDYSEGQCPTDSFRIYRDTGILAEIVSSARSYDDTTAASGQTYNYYIAGFNTCGEGTASNSDDGFIPLSVVDNPTNCQASDDDCLKITVAWDWSGDYHQGFTIFRDSVEVGQVDSTVRIFEDNDAPAGVTYNYYVLAYNPCGDGPQSNIDSGFRPESITEVPTNVIASDSQCTQVTVDWEWSGTGEDGFIIYRDSDSIDVVGPAGRSYTDTNTPAFCVSYDYQVAAASTNCGEGPLSIADPGTAIGPADGTASNLAASDSDCSLISLSWDYSEGQCPTDSFRIYRDAGMLAEVASGARSYEDTSATAGQTYSYYIAGFNTCGEGTASNSDDGYIPLSVVDNPTNCQASDDDCLKITVTWDWSGDYHQGFTIFRDDAEVGQVDSTVRVFDDNDAPAGVTYDYYVLAYNPCGNGPQSNIDSGFRPESITEAPANVTASDAQCSQVTVDWEWTETNHDGFIIYRDTDSIDVVGPAGRSYTDTNGPAFCISYDYQVAAASTNCGEGPLSIADPGTAIGPADGTASNLTASDSNCSLISLSWDYNEGQCQTDGFRIYRDAGMLAEVASSVRSYEDMTATAGQTYNYYIAGFNSCGEGSVSNSDDGYQPPTLIVSPTNVEATDDDCASIIISWDWTGIVPDGFKIFRDDTEIAQANSNIRIYSDETAVMDQTYSYYITAFNICGNSQQSNIDNGFRPASITEAPNNVVASDDECNQVTVNWEWNGEDADGFQIIRNGLPIGDVDSSSRSYLDDSPVNVCYSNSYRVAAFSIECGNGPSSIADDGTAIMAPDASITNLVATDNQCGVITITWDVTLGNCPLDSLHLYRGLNKISLPPDHDGYNDFDATPGESYLYQVKAFNQQCGEGSESNPDIGEMIPTLETPPANCNATDDDCEKITVTWNFSGAYHDGFNIIRDDSIIAQVSPASRLYEDYSAEQAINYNFRIEAYNDCGESPTSNTDNGYRSPSITVAPSNVQASDDQCEQITFSWDWNGSNQDGFRIYRESNLIGEVSESSRSFVDSSPPLYCTEYSYWAAAYSNDCGDGPSSDTTTGTALGVPNGLFSSFAVSEDSCSAIYLSWSYGENQCPLSGFRIYRDGSPLVQTGPGESTYEDASAQPDTAYSYYMAAYNSCGNGILSNTEDGYIPPTLSQSPTNCDASDHDCEKVTVTWDWTGTGHDGFKIYREDEEIGTANPPDRLFEDGSASAGVTHSYNVRGYTLCGEGPPSNSDDGYRSPDILEIPTNVQATTDECGQVTITWEWTGADEEGFRIQRDGGIIGEVGPEIRYFVDTNPNGFCQDRIYEVAAFSIDCGNGQFSDDGIGYAIIAPDAIVSNLNATDDQCEFITLTWDISEGICPIDGVHLYRGDDFITLPPDSTIYNDYSATPGTPQYYLVKPFNDQCGEGSSSGLEQGFMIPRLVDSPLNCVATDNECDRVSITWEWTADFHTGFHVLRNSIPIADVDSGVRIYDDYDAQAGVEYLYQITAFNLCGNSPFSDPDSGYRPPTITETPENVQATDYECAQVTITWDWNGENQDGFYIYRNSSIVGQAGVNDTMFVDLGAPGGCVSQDYQVAAFSDDCENGQLSEPVEGMAVSRPDAVISNLVASDGLCDVINVSWEFTEGQCPTDSLHLYRYGNFISLPPNVTEYYDSLASPGETYSYHLKPFNIVCGEGNASNTELGYLVPTLAVSPTNCIATDGECERVRVTWNWIGSYHQGFKIFRNTTQVGDVAAMIRIFDDTSAVSGEIYNYTVAAFNQCGDGDSSEINEGSVRNLPNAVSLVSPEDSASFDIEEDTVSVEFIWYKAEDNDSSKIILSTTEGFEPENIVYDSVLTADDDTTLIVILGVEEYYWTVSTFTCSDTAFSESLYFRIS